MQDKEEINFARVEIDIMTGLYEMGRQFGLPLQYSELHRYYAKHLTKRQFAAVMSGLREAGCIERLDGSRYYILVD